ncbi:LysM peptidoglycan-binding domain-containing protein [Kitasatospora sp. NPDC086791]|uniref:LysM peptidoglycan-binding domain-containing protein n=1 Tax=Kitasatospora sp. NPDC086791 TaxID=3155178 RepID=UPI003441AA7E
MVKTKPATAARSLGDVVRAVLAGIALLALLAAVPWGLITFIGNPLPSTVPSWDSITAQTVSVDVIINVIAVVVWAAWAQFALCVLVEVRAAVKGVGLAVRVPAAGVSQALARQLVASVFVIGVGALTVGQASAATAATPVQAPRVAATATALPQQAAVPATVSAAASATASSDHNLPTYEVQRSADGHRDTLWGIAESKLGDGTRWNEIQKLNEGRPQADGGALGADGLIRPGWTLLLPADASGTDVIRSDSGPARQASTAAQDTAAQHMVTVVKGDTLSGIAERELGDGDKYPELLDASKDLVQPDGGHLTNPDELFPGQKIVIPAAATATPPAAPAAPAPAQQPVAPTVQAPPVTPAPATAPPAPSTPAPQAPSTAAPSAPTSSTPAPAAPATQAPTEQTPIPAQEAPTQAPAPAQHSSPAGEEASSQSLISARSVAGLGALTGAGLLGAIAVRRLLQYRRRRPGETIAVPDETSRLEALLGRTAQPGSAALLDIALRTLADALPEDEALPELRAARVTSESVEILPEEHGLEPAAPFTAGDNGWWTLDPKAPLLDEEHAGRVAAPYPGLASIGRDEAGNQVLLHLPHVQVLLLEGELTNVRAVARSIALDAATCPWAGHIDVLTAGFGRDLAPLLPTGRARFVPTAHAGIVDLAGLRAETIQAEESGEDGPLPWLMVCTDDPGEHTWELAEILSQTRGRDIAVVLPADAQQVHDFFPEAEILDADALAAQACGLADLEVVLARVSDEEHAQIVSTLEVTAKPATPAAGPWEFVPDPDAVPPRFGPASIPAPLFADRIPADVTGAAPKENGDDDLAPSSSAPQTDAEVDTDVDDAALQADDDGTPEDDEAATPAHTTAAVNMVKPAAVRDRKPVPPSPDQPQIQVLGPVQIANSSGAETTHGPRLAALAAFLYFRPDRDYGAIAYAMDPVSPWEPHTLQTRISQLRGQLGHAPDGTQYLPRKSAAGTYRLSEQLHCDWTWFEYLAERGLPQGVAGLEDLEQALGMVRGRPFGTDGDHDWATPDVQQMICRIIDVAHTTACLRLRDEALDLDAARRAVAVGLEVQEDEMLYRDWLRIEAASGNRPGLFAVIDAARTAAASLDSDLTPETKRLIEHLLQGQHA